MGIFSVGIKAGISHFRDLRENSSTLSKASILTKNFLLLPPENIHRPWKLVHGNSQQTPRDLQREDTFSGITHPI